MIRLRHLAVALGTALGLTAAAIPAVADTARQPIVGSGSSWASNAVNQWIADVDGNGIKVTFTPGGSAQGRKDFANRTNDFAVTDIPFQGSDKATGDTDTNQGRDYAYLPIVAGGTSFPYQVRVGGQLVRNIRLSGQTLAKIFTNQITNWNDPAITADNNGRALPSLQIIPVVHSEGSGSTAQFTRYLDAQYPDLWRPYAGFSGGTEYFPRQGQQIAATGSDGVMNFLVSQAGNGAIGYDEYSYALAKNFPVIKVLNQAGNFVLPTQYNVAVALTLAKINQDKTSPDYLTQDLTQVYSNSDPRAYPLSSYSYGLIPTAAGDQTMSTAKRQTLVDYLYYSICQGQKEVGPIGYSPLPVNLVQASFDQINKLHDADSNVDITKRDVSTCNNPTFIPGQPNTNYLVKIAPAIPACDAKGQGPCTDAGDPGTVNPPTNGAGQSVGGGKSAAPGGKAPATGKTGATSGKPGAAGTTGAGAAGTTGATAGAASGSTASGGGGAAGGSAAATGTTVDPATGQVAAAAGTTVDPATGQVVSADGTAAADTAGGTAVLSAQPTTLSGSTTGASPLVLGSLAALLLLAALAAPPLVAARLRGRRTPGGGQ